MVAMGNILYILALKYTTMTKVLLLFYANPVWTVLFQYTILKERLTKGDIISLTCAVTGLIFIFGSKPMNAKGEDSNEAFLDFIGCLMAGTAGMSQSMSAVISRLIGDKVPAFCYTFTTFAIGSIVAPVVSWTDNFAGADPMNSFDVVFWVFASSISGLFYEGGRALACQMETPTRVMIIEFLDFVFLPILDVYVFGTTYGTGELVGMVLIVGSSVSLALLRVGGYIK
jgi:drug/metabolite transporter (DMT)-like permease